MKNLEAFLANSKQLREAATPGPWFDARTTKGIQVTAKSSAFTRGNFYIFRYPTRTDGSLVSHEEWEANIALILAARNTGEIKDEMIRIMTEALDWVIHPKHDEPDDYTRLACAQHRAFEALAQVEQLASDALTTEKL